MVDLDKEFQLLIEYMNVYIQLLPYYVPCGGCCIQKHYMPSFEYFKDTYDSDSLSMSIPHFKESKEVYGDRIGVVNSKGLGGVNGMGYRYYNSWLGCKYFTGGNIEGNYTINESYVNAIMKKT